jgi:peptidyl-prolyl cis-trans isomerase B (cyclophilin B)
VATPVPPAQVPPAVPPATVPAAPPAAYAPEGPKTNVLGIVSLVTAILGISIAAVITGHIALSQIKKRGEAGHGIALAGLIIGYVGCAIWIIFWIFWIVLLASGAAWYNMYDPGYYM